MDLRQISQTFDRIKEKIRNIGRFKKSYNGLYMANIYSDIVEYLTKSLFDLTKIEMNRKNKKRIAAFLYGSAGRREMIAESDLDVILIYEDILDEYIGFKKRFKKLAEPFNFCKIDLPDWGSLEEIKIFAEKSITEGNQVLESRFVCGDKSIKDKVEFIQNMYGTVDRMIRNIIWQKFYFEQYFKQRVRNGAINIKYCEGGSRDFLFIYWFDELMKRKYQNWNKMREKKPAIQRGLYNLYQNNLISFSEFSKAIDAVNFILLLRNEVLLVNKGTPDEGLTFLDKKTLDSVFQRAHELMAQYKINSPEDLADYFNKQRFYISKIKKRIWNLMIDEIIGKELKDENWSRKFRKAYSPLTSEKERASFLDSKDLLIKIATIWGASNSNQIKLLDKICEKEKDSDSWEIQAAIVASPHCNPDYLHYIATGLGMERGYGYLLRIISRNPNVKRKTLEAIANNPKLELRYRQCAKAALEHGKETANHQI